MNKFQLIQQTLLNKAGRKTFMLKKYSPEILMGLGVAGVITSTVMACKATLKMDKVVDEAGGKWDQVDFILKHPDVYTKEYSEEDAKKDKIIIVTQTAVEVAKLYAPAIAVGVISVSALLGSHKVMKERNLAVVAAYNGLKLTYDKYRDRVIEEFGFEKDRDYRYGVREEEVTVTETDDKGKEKKVTKTVKSIDPNHVSGYAKFFDDGCPQWSKNPLYNKTFLRTQQNYANDLLLARGHLFLNEVYDMLGMPRDKAGSVVGWYIDNDPDSDNYVDFGIYDTANSAFVNGDEATILLDFNVQGVIYDRI